MQMGRERFFERAAKKRLQHALKGAATGLVFRLARSVDHLPATLPPPEVPLFFQDVHHSAHRHGRRRGRNGFDDLVDSRFPERKDSVHDLTLASTKFGWF